MHANNGRQMNNDSSANGWRAGEQSAQALVLCISATAVPWLATLPTRCLGDNDGKVISIID